MKCDEVIYDKNFHRKIKKIENLLNNQKIKKNILKNTSISKI